MALTVPSMLATFLQDQFGVNAPPRDHSGALERRGALVAFLRMYRDMPEELNILQGVERSRFLASIGTIEGALAEYQNGRNTDAFRPVPHAIFHVRELLDKLPDAVPSAAHDLAFIVDLAQREMIAVDLFYIRTAIGAGAWKGATIIAGSCAEALLLYGLESKKAVSAAAFATAYAAAWPGGQGGPHQSDLIDHSWNLFRYSEMAKAIGLISENTVEALKPARLYRNLIHPSKAIRDQQAFATGTAYVAVGARELVLDDVRRNI
jgi:hypothetical protein